MGLPSKPCGGGTMGLGIHNIHRGKGLGRLGMYCWGLIHTAQGNILASGLVSTGKGAGGGGGTIRVEETLPSFQKAAYRGYCLVTLTIYTPTYIYIPSYIPMLALLNTWNTQNGMAQKEESTETQKGIPPNTTLGWWAKKQLEGTIYVGLKWFGNRFCHPVSPLLHTIQPSHPCHAHLGGTQSVVAIPAPHMVSSTRLLRGWGVVSR